VSRVLQSCWSHISLVPQGVPESPESPASAAWNDGSLAAVQKPSSSGLMAASLVPRLRQRTEAADVDRRHLVRRGLIDVAIVIRMNELAPGGGRPAGGNCRYSLVGNSAYRFISSRIASSHARKPEFSPVLVQATAAKSLSSKIQIKACEFVLLPP